MEKIPRCLSKMMGNKRKILSWGKKDSMQCQSGEKDSRDLHFFKLILQLMDVISGFLDRISVNRLLLIVKPLSDTGEAALQIQLRFKI